MQITPRSQSPIKNSLIASAVGLLIPFLALTLEMLLQGGNTSQDLGILAPFSESPSLLSLCICTSTVFGITFAVASKQSIRLLEEQAKHLLNATTRRDIEDNIVGVIGVGQDITEAKKAQAAEQRLAAELTQFIDTANAPIFGIDVNGKVNEWNQQAANITGFAKEEVMGSDLVADFITDDYKESVREVLENALQGAERANYEFPLFTKAKRQVDVLLNATTRRDIEGNIVGVIGVGQDITELREKNAALQQARKMEAVGQLTGGIAHDFNNLLTVIIGNLIYLRDDTGLIDEETAEAMDDAIVAAQDGAELTQSLLRFARTGELKPIITNISHSIDKSIRFLSRSLGENITIETEYSFDTLYINIDPIQFENALLNLTLNSRDAMPEGGTITISTSLHHQTLNDSLGTGLKLGTYVRITIKDTGQGISPDHLSHIFEPFFSTKERERGTGLGLSMVYGFTQQSGGACLIDESTPRGTSISLFYPNTVPETASSSTIQEAPSQDYNHHGIVLVVEDEPRVRKITTRDLQRLGYEVYEAENAEQAQHILKSGDHVDLLLSDVLMPGEMDGFQLAQWTSQHYPKIKIILLSGYTSRQEKEEESMIFRLIRKPYDQKILMAELQRALEGSPRKNGQNKSIEKEINHYSI